MRVVESIFVPEFKEGHRQERKWAHRVMWQRWRQFNVTIVRCMIVVGNTYHCHPNTYKILKDQMQ